MNNKNNSYWNAGRKVGIKEVIAELKKLIRSMGRSNMISIAKIEQLINDFENKLIPSPEKECEKDELNRLRRKYAY